MQETWQEHPLLQRAGVSDALVELHPETSFAEDFSQAVTWRRMLVFTGAILFSLGLAVLNDHRLFASQHTVHVATSAACQAACRATVHCDVDSLTFRTVFCTAAAAECSEEAVGSRSVEFAVASAAFEVRIATRGRVQLLGGHGGLEGGSHLGLGNLWRVPRGGGRAGRADPLWAELSLWGAGHHQQRAGGVGLRVGKVEVLFGKALTGQYSLASILIVF